MEKDYSQLDLFSKNSENPEADFQMSRSFSAYVRKYEKTVLVIIGFIITGLVSFSLGVEKGKNMAAATTKIQYDMAAKPPLPQQQRPGNVPTSMAGQFKNEPQQYTRTQVSSLPQQVQVKKVPAVTAVNPASGSYAIQVGTYRTKSLAEKEVEFLKRKGMPSWIASQGTYTILLVGKFSDKDKAQVYLSELKKQYRDCFIRRL